MAELVTRVVDIPSSRALGKDARTGARALANHGLQPHTPMMQPYVSQDATLCTCRRAHLRQPRRLG